MSNQPSNLPAKIEQQEQTLAALLKRYEGNIRAALPEHLKPERMLSIIRTAITTNPGLRNCSPLSVIASIVAASRLGLECDGTLGQAYLIPRKSKHSGRVEACFQMGYQGKIELTRRSGEVEAVECRLVYEGDEFEVSYTPAVSFRHAPRFGKDRGAPMCAYVYVKYKTGHEQVEIMDIAEALRIRDRHAPRNDAGQIVGPWATDEEEMVRKTALHRAWKWMPKSVEMREAMRIENRLDAGESAEVVVLDLPAEATESAGMAGATDAKTETLKKRLAEKQEQQRDLPQQKVGGEATGGAPAAPAVSGSTDDGAEGEGEGPGPQPSPAAVTAPSPKPPRVFKSFPDPLAVPDEEIVVAGIVYQPNADRNAWVKVGEVRPPAQTSAAPPTGRAAPGRRGQGRGNQAASDAFDFAGGKS